MATNSSEESMSKKPNLDDHKSSFQQKVSQRSSMRYLKVGKNSSITHPVNNSLSSSKHRTLRDHSTTNQKPSVTIPELLPRNSMQLRYQASKNCLETLPENDSESESISRRKLSESQSVTSEESVITLLKPVSYEQISPKSSLLKNVPISKISPIINPENDPETPSQCRIPQRNSVFNQYSRRTQISNRQMTSNSKMDSSQSVLAESPFTKRHSMPAQFNVWRRSFQKKSLKRFEPDSEQFDPTGDIDVLTTLPQKISMREVKLCHLTQKETKILATLIPDEVIRIQEFEKKDKKTFVGVLLFADVSGFTALCERYNNTGKGGTYRLTATLNSYIGAMVEVIYSHGGDVLKFSGDAFLAVWKVKRDEFMFKVIHDVLTCSLFIQKTLGEYETDVKVLLRVKLAISAGNITFAVIGDEKSQHYLLVGTPIEDVKMAERVCVSGDVILSPSAWGHCSANNYEYTYIDSEHVKVTHILYQPGRSKREIVLRETYKKMYDETRDKTMKKEEISGDNDFSTNATMRPCVSEAAERMIGIFLRPFMIPPVVQQIDAGQPLEYLTEMRQVTTMFVNLIPERVQTDKLILMVDQAYCVICSLVRNAMGVVNKVSMFDKDVMFLAIFGLRGYKHESESGISLKCAYSVHKAISNLKGVNCASVGVTTGMTYCGVVGHPLRREYTVIGAPVNMAARIMCAYPGKVTCEQNTYLHSKLPTYFFILQEPKELKGIGNCVPIYEYTEERRKSSESDQSEDTFPLLGREEETQKFITLLDTASQPFRMHSGLVIEGEARIGKSRLLEELINQSRHRGYTPIVLALTAFQSNIPYSAIHNIFRQALGLDENATVHDKEERLVMLLGSAPCGVAVEDLCYLNDIMQVKFPLSKRYLAATPDEKRDTTKEIFKELVRWSSHNLVIALDDAQYIDPQSWELLPNVLNENTTFLVMTMYDGYKAFKSVGATQFLTNERLLKLRLDGLDNSYMAALACQFLNVKAISSEIDDLLQKKSKGNPGWCESFLVSLLHSGGLKLKEVTESELKVEALVAPQKSLIQRRTIFPDTKCLSDLHKKDKKEVTYSVCVVAENFNISEKLIPQNIDAMIMTVFDCLTPYEQLLLKCGSVLGQSFTRTMLTAVMHNPIPTQTAKAVKRLFELRVLGCSSFENEDVYIEQTNFVVTKSTLNLADQNRTVSCFCKIERDVNIDNWEQLPKYAFCKLMHFKILLFRSITYDLLPGNQKKEFHARAVYFLEIEAHKCNSCGGGDFVKFPSFSEEEEIESETLIKEAKKSKYSLRSLISQRSIIRSNHDNKIAPSEMKSVVMNLQNDQTSTAPAEKSESQADEDQKLVTQTLPRKRRRQKYSKSESYLSFTRSFQDVDFRNCECPLILSGVYQQLIEHCAAAGLKEKQIKFMIEFGAVAISVGNNIRALNLLLEARELSMKEDQQNEVDISRATRRFNLGKIHALIGHANLDLGELKTSEEHLFIAMHKFGVSFWKLPVMSHMQYFTQLLNQWFHQHFPGVFIGRARGRNILLCDEIAAGLSHLSNLYMVENKWTLAKFAAMKSLNNAEESNTNLYELCAAYSNVMDACHHFGQLGYCWRLEKTALQTSKHKYTGSEAKELLALGRLYCSIFSSRLFRGELQSALKIGFKALQIGSRVFANNVKLFIYPLLIQGLILAGRIDESVDLLHELDFEARDLDKASSAWYYALCLDMILETGFSPEHANNCIQFCNQLKENESAVNIILRDPDVERRLVISAWLWSLRTEDGFQSRNWRERTKTFKYLKPEDSFNNIISTLKYLESLLISMSYGLQKKMHFSASSYRNEALHLLKKLNGITKTAEVFRPRYLHLKAYMSAIKQHKSKALALLKEGSVLAIKQGNKMDDAWISHSKAAWTSRINGIDQNFWKENCSQENDVNWQEFNLHEWSSIMYSLPLPVPL